MDNVLMVGNPLRFAIESFIAEPFDLLSQKALGYFVLHISGQIYGVRSEKATLLACSLDSVRNRLFHRGMHTTVLADIPTNAIVNAVQSILYEDMPTNTSRFFGILVEDLHEELLKHELIFAPDGDAAFDDGSHVLQFDQENRVRLVAFKNDWDKQKKVSAITDIWIDADEFYGILDDWQKLFESAWRTALKARL